MLLNDLFSEWIKLKKNNPEITILKFGKAQ